ncbi:uncharacterized protein F4822DRAFT_397263 [Hypoxylon trugodes]|uniref:uncharacterized protein n=1 Tax=Hypoxylon trugodes TaxID=326681 RepID=UPI002192F8C9|nr:uncharacterized protein F4822DRAFT_397263 [Hypoxylon trugodes]KAI1391612.1 hypothetical protein F4822DRAFT_397263 [Hypoxylon trugodes]
MSNAFSTGYGISSPTSTEPGTLISTPSTSRANSTSLSSSENFRSGPLNLTSLSTTSWRQPYASVGQFATIEPGLVVAAGPNGLFYFKRIRDHAATPWSESRPLPTEGVILNESTVSGLALHDTGLRLHLCCISGGVIHTFYLTGDNNLLPDRGNPPPLGKHRAMGKPMVVRSGYNRLSLVVPCQSGGLLHTSGSYYSFPTRWERVDYLATDLGVISGVSVTEVRTHPHDHEPELVAVCISEGQLHVVQGPFSLGGGRPPSRCKWGGKTSIRILQPGKVTGNPVLITDDNHGQAQLDLLVPSAEGGIFHFVRTHSAPNEWHMIGRVAFPQDTPPASCLSFYPRSDTRGTRELHAMVQIGGRLYHTKTTNDQLPWYNARLNPIVHPGPFFD